MARRAFGWNRGTDGRPDARTHQARLRLRGQPVGRRRPRHARALRDHPDGGVVMRCGTQDLGVGTKTLMAIITAETLGLPVGA
jgi:CO/xanthine dehydrogenase Mo-binding subunit